MINTPAPADLPPRALVGYAVKYLITEADPTPATLVGRLAREGLIDGVSPEGLRVVAADVLEHQNDNDTGNGGNP